MAGASFDNGEGKGFHMIIAWYVLYLVLGSPIATIGPFPDKVSCQSVVDQIKREIHPKIAVCINVDHIGEQPNQAHPK